MSRNPKIPKNVVSKKKIFSNEAKQGFLLAFGELFLKSKGVQTAFKKRLLNNLSCFLLKEKIDFLFFSWRDRVFLETKSFQKTNRVLKKLFGISWFARAVFLEGVQLPVLENFIKAHYHLWLKEGRTFALRVRVRERKESREEVIEKIAGSIKRKVNLARPQKEIFIEGRKQGWFLYFRKNRAIGGLPAGSQGRVLCLISGGIDSAAAAFLAAKRGAENVWLHFHSFPLASRQSQEKVRELGKIFLDYQPRLKVYFLPFVRLQTEIRSCVPANYRVLFYRALMFEIAEKIAENEKCAALVTGEALGQVSSQTLNNLKIVQKAVRLPVLRPLIGFDKEEIISLARRIGTFEISSRPQEDCCTLFVPKHQTACADPVVFNVQRNKLKVKKYIKSALKEARIEKF